jgi:hypothetical protein
MSILAILVLGALFAGGNLWFTAARSAIPLELRGTVTQKQRLIEKSPGVDDVYIVTIDSGRQIQLDGHVFDAIAEGQSINKLAMTRTLEIEGADFALSWSRDFRGMRWAMPLAVTILVVLGTMAVEHPRQNDDERRT